MSQSILSLLAWLWLLAPNTGPDLRFASASLSSDILQLFIVHLYLHFATEMTMALCLTLNCLARGPTIQLPMIWILQTPGLTATLGKTVKKQHWMSRCMGRTCTNECSTSMYITFRMRETGPGQTSISESCRLKHSRGSLQIIQEDPQSSRIQEQTRRQHNCNL